MDASDIESLKKAGARLHGYIKQKLQEEQEKQELAKEQTIVRDWFFWKHNGDEKARLRYVAKMKEAGKRLSKLDAQHKQSLQDAAKQQEAVERQELRWQQDFDRYREEKLAWMAQLKEEALARERKAQQEREAEARQRRDYANMSLKEKVKELKRGRGEAKAQDTAELYSEVEASLSPQQLVEYNRGGKAAKAKFVKGWLEKQEAMGGASLQERYSLSSLSEKEKAEKEAQRLKYKAWYEKRKEYVRAKARQRYWEERGGRCEQVNSNSVVGTCPEQEKQQAIVCEARKGL